MLMIVLCLIFRSGDEYVGQPFPFNDHSTTFKDSSINKLAVGSLRYFDRIRSFVTAAAINFDRSEENSIIVRDKSQAKV